jgi:hypothetical protein
MKSCSGPGATPALPPLRGDLPLKSRGQEPWSNGTEHQLQCLLSTPPLHLGGPDRIRTGAVLLDREASYR